MPFLEASVLFGQPMGDGFTVAKHHQAPLAFTSRPASTKLIKHHLVSLLLVTESD